MEYSSQQGDDNNTGKKVKHFYFDSNYTSFDKMSMARKYCDINMLQHYIKRWVDTSGSNFNEWKNPDVNNEVVKVLLITMSVKEIIELNIPALGSALDVICHKQSAVDVSEPAECKQPRKPPKRTVLKDVDYDFIVRSPNFPRTM